MSPFALFWPPSASMLNSVRRPVLSYRNVTCGFLHPVASFSMLFMYFALSVQSVVCGRRVASYSVTSKTQTFLLAFVFAPHWCLFLNLKPSCRTSTVHVPTTKSIRFPFQLSVAFSRYRQPASSVKYNTPTCSFVATAASHPRPLHGDIERHDGDPAPRWETRLLWERDLFVCQAFNGTRAQHGSGRVDGKFNLVDGLYAWNMDIEAVLINVARAST